VGRPYLLHPKAHVVECNPLGSGHEGFQPEE